MKFKLTVHPALEAGNPWTTFKFETIDDMKLAKDCMANLLLFIQDQAKVMDDYSNMFIQERFVNGEWIEIEEDEDETF